MATVRDDLRKAYDLINKDRLEEALAILRPITLSDPDNADAWWLTANAASEPRDARRALVNVLKLNPKYPKARQLLDQLNEMYPPRDDELLMMLEIEDVEPEMPSGALDSVSFDLDDEEESTSIDDLFTLDEDEDFEPVQRTTVKSRARDEDLFAVEEDDFATVAEDDPFASLLAEDTPRQRSAGRGRWLLGAVALVGLMIVLAGIVFGFVLGGDDDDTTDEGTAPADPGDLVAADVAALSNVSVDELESVRAATEQEARTLVDPSAEAVYIQAGDGLALMLRVCTTPGPNIPTLVQNSFEVVAPRGGIPSLSGQITMVGVSVQDCTNQDVLYRAMASAADAVAFSNNSTDYSAFQQTWTNIES